MLALLSCLSLVVTFTNICQQYCYLPYRWCPPCRAFTPTLSEAYTTLKSLKKNVELAFVSSDRDEESFNDYFKKMSFCALPFENRNEKAALSKMFDVSGIPTLVMLGPENEKGERPLINGNVRSFIESKSYDEFPFHKKNYGDVDSADGLNDTRSLIIFHENGDDEEQEQVKEVIKEVAAKFKDAKDDEALNVHWALSHKGLSTRIRELTELPSAEKSEDPAMIILDIPDEGGYYKSVVTDITVDNVIEFVKSPGERFQLS